MAEKLVPGDPIGMVKLADLLWRSMHADDLEIIGLDLRGSFRVGGEIYEGSISGGKEGWKLYLKDSWEYRYLADREIRTIRVKGCDRIMTMLRDAKSGKMYQGRVLDGEEGMEWRVVEMRGQE